MHDLRLPRDTTGDWEGMSPACPWCRGDMDDATLTVEQLLCAHGCNALGRPNREVDGQPDVHAVVLACPQCARPSMMALRLEHGFPVMRLLPVRTAADARCAAGGAP